MRIALKLVLAITLATVAAARAEVPEVKIAGGTLVEADRVPRRARLAGREPSGPGPTSEMTSARMRCPKGPRC